MPQKYEFRGCQVDTDWVYRQIPSFYDRLSCVIPGNAVSRRGVEICHENGPTLLFELWSPNSHLHQFYPGPVTSLLGAQNVKPDLPFPDGKYPLLNPTNWECANPELIPLLLVWVPSYSKPRKGRIYVKYAVALETRTIELRNKVLSYASPCEPDKPTQYVLNHWPSYPALDDVHRLCAQNYWSYDELVQQFRSVLHGLIEMEAWLTLMEYLPIRNESSSLTSIPRVNNQHVGVWLNAADEKDILWILWIGIIPAYVIHQLVQDEDFPVTNCYILDHRPSTWYCNFVKDTPAEALNSQSNPYIYVFAKNASDLLLPPHHLQKFLCFPQFSVDRRKHINSSSWAYEQQAGGWGSWGHSTSHSSGIRLWARCNEDIENGIWNFASCSRPLDSMAVNSDNSSRHSFGCLIEDVCYGTFWLPLPIACGPDTRKPMAGRRKKKNKMSWDHFYEEDAEDIFPLDGVPKGLSTVMVRCSKKSTEAKEYGADSDSDEGIDDTCYEHRDKRLKLDIHVVWDRHNGRKLHFRESLQQDKQVYYNDKMLGFPLAKLSYWALVNRMPKEVFPPSSWAYYDVCPPTTRIGDTLSIEACRPTLPVSNGVDTDASCESSMAYECDVLSGPAEACWPTLSVSNGVDTDVSRESDMAYEHNVLSGPAETCQPTLSISNGVGTDVSRDLDMIYEPDVLSGPAELCRPTLAVSNGVGTNVSCESDMVYKFNILAGPAEMDSNQRPVTFQAPDCLAGSISLNCDHGSLVVSNHEFKVIADDSNHVEVVADDSNHEVLADDPDHEVITVPAATHEHVSGQGHIAPEHALSPGQLSTPTANLLLEKFGLNFWDIVNNITSEELATCTLDQQEYITTKRAEQTGTDKHYPPPVKQHDRKREIWFKPCSPDLSLLLLCKKPPVQHRNPPKPCLRTSNISLPFYGLITLTLNQSVDGVSNPEQNMEVNGTDANNEEEEEDETNDGTHPPAQSTSLPTSFPPPLT
ncbi:hypothetical protein BDQ17DRAFT_1434318 [Cyathus striatus]|nr:hypothetical protein BDQ17DRAFT_1434318 [Cyathus striatus]